MRVRMPRGGPGLEAVIVNTAGGVCCGDRFTIEASAGPGAHLTIATPAAEKVYRSDGPWRDLRVAGGRRSTAGMVATGNHPVRPRPAEAPLRGGPRAGRHLSFEGPMLGRLAHGDVMGEGHIEDHWRIRRGGALVFAGCLPPVRPHRRAAGAAGRRGWRAGRWRRLHIAPGRRGGWRRRAPSWKTCPARPGPAPGTAFSPCAGSPPTSGQAAPRRNLVSDGFPKGPASRVWAT